MTRTVASTGRVIVRDSTRPSPARARRSASAGRMMGEVGAFMVCRWGFLRFSFAKSYVRLSRRVDFVGRSRDQFAEQADNVEAPVARTPPQAAQVHRDALIARGQGETDDVHR